MATLTVGFNKQYASLSTALEAARDGDLVAVSSGLYINDYATIHTKVTLTAVGGKVTLLATAPLASGKALLTVTTDAVVDGFVFAGAKAADGTAAGHWRGADGPQQPVHRQPVRAAGAGQHGQDGADPGVGVRGQWRRGRIFRQCFRGCGRIADHPGQLHP